MPDERITQFAGQVQTLFLDDFKADPLPRVPLMALAKTDLVPTGEGSNTFRIFKRPFVRGQVETLAEFRARASSNNPLTTGTNAGQIVSKEMPNQFEDHTVDTVFTCAYDLEHTAGIDAKFNSPERVAKRARQTYQDSLLQFQHEQLASLMPFADEWIVPDVATISLSDAVTAGDTTFNITNAEKVSSNIAIGDMVKLGDKRAPNALDGAVEEVEVALVKTIGADGSGTTGGDSLITIETDRTLFPVSDTLAGPVFNKLVILLAAHASGARVQLDKPTAVNTQSIDELMTQVRTSASRSFIMPNRFILYFPPEPFAVLHGSSSTGVAAPLLANDFLGRDVLLTGETGIYRGMKILSDANAVSRTQANSTVDLAATRHYIWAFEMNESIAFAHILSAGTVDRIQGTAGLLEKLSWAEVSGPILSRQGAIRSIMIPVTV